MRNRRSIDGETRSRKCLEHGAERPLLFSRLATGTASTSNRILSAEERNAQPFFNEFFRPIGLTETLAGNLFNDRGRFSLIGVQRGDDRPPFGGDDIARLERWRKADGPTLRLATTSARVRSRPQSLVPAGMRKKSTIA
jgi:hypothetical protein